MQAERTAVTAGRPLRVGVTGDRAWTCRRTIRERLAVLPPGSTVVHGACPDGADRIADEEARALGLQVERHPAPWSTLRRVAGPGRNAAPATTVELLLAFHDDLRRSRGTIDALGRADRAGVPWELHRSHAARTGDDGRQLQDEPEPAAGSYLLCVDLPHAVFALVVRDGLVVDGAPISRRSVGRRAVDVEAYYRRRGATVQRRPDPCAGGVGQLPREREREGLDESPPDESPPDELPPVVDVDEDQDQDDEGATLNGEVIPTGTAAWFERIGFGRGAMLADLIPNEVADAMTPAERDAYHAGLERLYRLRFPANRSRSTTPESTAADAAAPVDQARTQVALF